MQKRTYYITCKYGLHARPATNLVNETVKFASDVFLTFDEDSINLKSIMGLMSLGVSPNSKIEIRAVGTDEEEAINHLTNYLAANDIAVLDDAPEA
jgi:phosphocarrier protein